MVAPCGSSRSPARDDPRLLGRPVRRLLPTGQLAEQRQLGFLELGRPKIAFSTTRHVFQLGPENHRPNRVGVIERFEVVHAARPS